MSLEAMDPGQSSPIEDKIAELREREEQIRTEATEYKAEAEAARSEIRKADAVHEEIEKLRILQSFGVSMEQYSRSLEMKRNVDKTIELRGDIEMLEKQRKLRVDSRYTDEYIDNSIKAQSGRLEKVLARINELKAATS